MLPPRKVAMITKWDVIVNINTLICIFWLSLVTSSFAAYSDDGVYNRGKIHLRGNITTSTCHVLISNSSQIVEMGMLRTNQFSSLGSLSDAVPFEIELQGCDRNFTIAFYGVSDSKDPQVLKAGRGVNAVKGVGLAIFDLKGNIIPPDSIHKRLDKTYPRESPLRFVARYRATSRQVIGGNADAWTEFKLSYY